MRQTPASLDHGLSDPAHWGSANSADLLVNIISSMSKITTVIVICPLDLMAL